MGVEDIRKSIRDASDLGTEIVVVPEWNDVKIELRVMTGEERALMWKRTQGPDGKMLHERFYPEVLIASCFDPDTGERVFSSADINWLNKKSSAVLDRLATQALNISGMSAEAYEQLGNASASTPSDDSTSS